MPESTTGLSNQRSEPPRLTESERYHLLSNGRRRALLEILGGRSAPLHIEELASAVAEREADGGAVAAEAQKAVVVALHHNHLPRLADLGLVTYDRESGLVEPDAADRRP